jgi:hypothetical protein|tara:strand:- start:173 stop:571 length:399 start_codon:yes stop_codon:yes gene_type:complete
MEWLQYFLIFAFGYLTCKTFYFFRATRTGILLVKSAQVISLAILAKSLENFAFSRTYKVLTLKENNASEQNIKAYTINIDLAIDSYKEKAIKHIVDQHSKFYKEILDFDDWKSGMKYLEQNREVANAFFLEE